MAWEGRWDKETPIVIFENVLGFDLEWLYALVAHMYEIVAVRWGPENVGFECVRRPRLYIAMLHKVKAGATTNLAWKCSGIAVFGRSFVTRLDRSRHNLAIRMNTSHS